MTEYAVGDAVVYMGRPAVVTTPAEVGGTGRPLYGVRFTDVERWEPDPHFPQYMRPVKGSAAIALAQDLRAASHDLP